MKEVSPFQAYNTIRLGVPGTGMPPFHELSDMDTWDLAFYVVERKQVSTLSDEKLGQLFSSKSDEERAQFVASLRTHSDDDDAGGGSLTLASTQLEEAAKDYGSYGFIW